MKHFVILFLFVCCSLFSFAQEDALGIWVTTDGVSHVEITKQGGKYSGKIVWLQKPTDSLGRPILDKYNLDKSKRTNLIMGTYILEGYDYDPESMCFTGGTIYDPRCGKTYKGRFWIDIDNRLNIRGYVGFVYQTEIWRRPRNPKQ